MDIKKEIYASLRQLDFSNDEVKLYICLLEAPNTHLQLARSTGINRTKVYRLIEQLEKRSLVVRRTDDRGTFLMASDPGALEIQLTAQEEKAKLQRAVLRQTLPNLRRLQQDVEKRVAVHTYEGVKGFRQMLWHELKTKGDLLVFGNVTVEEQVVDRRWAEKFRALAAANGHTTRQIFNRAYEPNFTANESYMELYSARIVPIQALPIATPMIVYNDTVAIYQIQDNKRVGTEIINAAYADTMRAIFEHYWQIGHSI